MTSTIFTVDAISGVRTALVVEPSSAGAVWAAAALSELGLRVVVSDSFHEATVQLTAGPALLVTALRLGAYNGLHLVLRGRSEDPHLAAIVMCRSEDPVLRLEAEKLGATLIEKGIPVRDFQAAVLRTLFAPQEVIRPPFERRMMPRRKLVTAGHLPERRGAERRRLLLVPRLERPAGQD